MRNILALSLLTAGCSTTIDSHVAPPADWPVLAVIEHRVPHAVMRDRCGRFTPWYASPEACAEWHFAQGECHIYFSADFPPAAWIAEHERMHCAGYDHPGSTAAKDAWSAFAVTYAGRALAEKLTERP